MSKCHVLYAAAAAILILLVLCSVPSSDAASEHTYSGEVVISEDTTLEDGSTVVFESGAKVDLGSHFLDLGAGSSVQFRGTVELVSDGGSIVFGKGSNVTFASEEQPALENIVFPSGDYACTMVFDGKLTLQYTYGLTSSTVTATYAPEGGDLVFTADGTDTARICTFDSLGLTYVSTPVGQSALSDYLSGSVTYEEMIAEFGILDSVSLDLDFGKCSMEERTKSGADYTYGRLEMVSTSSGEDLGFTLGRVGLTISSFQLDKAALIQGRSGSDRTTTLEVSGFKDPSISLSPGSSLSISFGADTVSYYETEGGKSSGVSLSSAKLVLTAKLPADFTISDLGSLAWNITMESDSANVFSGSGYSFTMTGLKVTAAFDGSTFSELNMEATVKDEKLTVAARGFKFERTEADSGFEDVKATIDSITVTYRGVQVRLGTVVMSVKNLDTDTLIQRYSEAGSIGLQDIIDVSDSATLDADSIVVVTGDTAEMEGAHIELSADADGCNILFVELGSAKGSVSTSSWVIGLELSPTTLTVKSQGSLSSVFDALFNGYTFTGDTSAVFIVVTENMAVSESSTEAGSSVELKLVPKTGKVTLTFEMDYTKASGRVVLSSDLDLSGAVLTISSTSKVTGSDEQSVVSFKLSGVTGHLETDVGVEGQDSMFTVKADLKADADLQFYYCGITCDISSKGSKIDLSSLSFTLKGYDCSSTGIVPMLSAIGNHDFKAVINGTVEAAELSLKTVKSTISGYTDVSVGIKGISVDMKRGDSMSLAIGELRINAKDPQGADLSKTISNFHFTKSLGSSGSQSEFSLQVLSVVLVVVIALVWCVTAYIYGFRKGAARSGGVRKD